MEVTTPSFLPDDIPPSSTFIQAVTQNPVEIPKGSGKSSVPISDAKNHEVHSAAGNKKSNNEGTNTQILQNKINIENTNISANTKEPNIFNLEDTSKESANLEVPLQLSTGKLENLEQTDSQEVKETSIPINDGKNVSTKGNQQFKNEGTNTTMIQDEIKIENVASLGQAKEESQNLEISQKLSTSTEKLEQIEKAEASEDKSKNFDNTIDNSKKPEQQDPLKTTHEASQPLGGIFSVFQSSQEVTNELEKDHLDTSEHNNNPETNILGVSKSQPDLDVPGSSDETVDPELNILNTRHLLSDDNNSKELDTEDVLRDPKFAIDGGSMKGIDIPKVKDSEVASENGNNVSDEDLSQISLDVKEIHKSDIEQKDVYEKQNMKKQNENYDKSENLEIPLQEKAMDIGRMSDDRLEQEILTLQDEAKEDSEAPKDEYPSKVVEENAGFFSRFMSWLGTGDSRKETELKTYSHPQSKAEENLENVWVNQAHEENSLEHCDANSQSYYNFNSDMFLYLVTSAISCIMFLFVYMAVDRSKKEAPLIARINKLEKELLVALKENELLQDKNGAIEVPEEVLEEFKHQLSEMQGTRDHMQLQVMELEMQVKKKDEQIESLEKELETSTEVGMELNRIISEMLDPTNGNDR
nr:unnamed protein product [Callosobruchus chinensis]